MAKKKTPARQTPQTDSLDTVARDFLQQAFSRPPECDVMLRMEIISRATQCGVTEVGNKVWMAPRERDLRALIEEATNGNYLSFRAAMLIAEHFVARSVYQPLPLQQFVTITAGGRWRPPVKPKVYDGDHAFRAWAVRFAIHQVLNESARRGLGIKPTRNEATDAQRSACAIVADAMASIQQKPDTEATVRKVWDKRIDVIKRTHPRYGKTSSAR